MLSYLYRVCALIILFGLAGPSASGQQATSQPAHAHDHPHAEVRPSRSLQFPDFPDGRALLVVDLHTHSVFSDGHVWPTVRVWESSRDQLDAMAVTEHLEYQPHRDDIPHPDRNRSFELAELAAANAGESAPLVIPGVEITRQLPPGHVNAVFVQDANPILTIERRADDNLANARLALEEAQRQGAFTFWNHPAWGHDAPAGIMQVPAEQQALVSEGLIQGIEVANGGEFSEEALQFALDNDLAILGTSDIHGLIDYDYDIIAGEHRTASLVIASERSLQGIRDGLEARQTVALFKNQFIGREDVMQTVLGAVLSLEVADYQRNSTVLRVNVRNDGPLPVVLQNVGPRNFANAASVVTIPAHGSLRISITDTPDPAAVYIQARVLNAYTAPRENPVIVLRP
ncbi:hypothetical protein AWH62_01745 [Maricaulis sp. W15]|uniref:Ig-like domain-containing protein n=1 Tax=Maricaulis maris TaxID=74318 RepID=A0A495DNI7_9PROT|nr:MULTISPECIES: Sb-PDE family phosphodiesterase [Maricaulis]OLF81418.1 hypothetical protein AWH62_01745 [Maricaulis sp. W15]RKR03821.1 hypothetical protein C7435_0261 [Maricaulis maris]